MRGEDDDSMWLHVNLALFYEEKILSFVIICCVRFARPELGLLDPLRFWFPLPVFHPSP
jgi:hypothetical protein